jgi:diadenosine tetraphosphate (Ap4A) HIT family hydrolase
MKNCIFCKIVKGEIESAKFWEDKKHLAILDVFPNTKGMALLLTKKHYPSYAFDMPEKEYRDFLLAARKVAKILEKGLKVKRVALVMEGMGIDHAHLKFYPLHGISKKFQEMWAPKKVYFKNYPGYISTQLGTQANPKKLKKLAEEIRKNSK